MPFKKLAEALPESPLSKLNNDPMRFLYGIEKTTPKEITERPLELSENPLDDEIEKLKCRLLAAEQRAQKAEKRSALLKKQIAEMADDRKQFDDPYGDELDWLLKTEQGHSTLRPTPIYNRVNEHVQKLLNDTIGVTIASPQFIGLGCCAMECLLKAADVNWHSDFEDLRNKVTGRHQTLLLRRFFDVMRRGLK